ncbi:sigma-E factor negative regulatory protein [Lentisalinibacter salinarum]|uniref:sigma-E factor negative regulatory protein n=1 Tax=Lentisalinibacter salinarum TaxID=2992239 RepID=UPI0038648722
MNDKLRDQMSAFLDDELPDGEAELLLRRLQADEELRRVAGRYLLIGQALRGERLAGIDLAGRVAAALDGETTYGGRAAGPGRSRWLRPAAGVAVAASVAVVALMGLQNTGEVAGPEAVTAETDGEAPVAAPLEGTAEGYAYTVPVDAAVTVRPVSAVPARLTNYMISHGERAGTLMRSGMHSRIVTQPNGPLVYPTEYATETSTQDSTVTSEDGRTGTAENPADDAAR